MVALTVHEDKTYLRKLLEAGASGYVLKRAVADELIRAIRTVAGGLVGARTSARASDQVSRRPLSGYRPTGAVSGL